MSSSPGSVAVYFRHLNALLWKNWLLKKRAWGSTLAEIVLPLVVALVMVAIRAAISKDDTGIDLHLDAFAPLNRTAQVQQILFTVSQTHPQSRLAFAPAAFAKIAIPAFAAAYPALANISMSFNDEGALEDYFSNPSYASGSIAYPPIWFAVVLDSQPQATNTLVPSDHAWAYTLRGNFTGGGDRSTMVNTYQDSVNNIHNIYTPDNWQTELQGGTVFMQDFMDTLIMQQEGVKNINRDVSFVPFPTPAYTNDPFVDSITQFIGLIFTLCFIWPVTRLVKGIVEEKQTRIKEGMKIMGMSEAAIWSSWLFTYAFIFLIIAVLMTLILSGSVFVYSNKLFVFFFFWLFGLSVFAFCYMISAFFSNAKLASSIGALVFLVLYFPYIAVSPYNVSKNTKSVGSLSLTIALSLGLVVMAEYEGSETGVNTANQNVDIDNYNFALACGMFVLDFVIYNLLGLYFSRVIPSEWGTALPWYFPFLPSFWCTRSDGTDLRRPLLINGKDEIPASASAVDGDDAAANVEGVSGAVAANLAVSVKQLRKEFPVDGEEAAVAVNNLSIDMYSGQILALLGHNGAGKTTTINMLTGMLPVTSGDASFFGLSVTRDMPAIRQMLGFCPQHNILFPELTVAEHLELFARIKGVPRSDIERTVEEAVQSVGLSEKKDTRSGALSGGMQRKLSVAIALLGNSKIVFLDEPTSGMDPYSRRATWDLLTKAKQEVDADGKPKRLIILTTHFMDEADQLGDRIAIMSRGSLRCCGSSLYLKSRYGVGYTLTISKNLSSGIRTSDASFTSLVTSHVPTALVTSSVAGEISFQLPLSSSSSFAPLFDVLDANLDKLGVQSYGVSVTTLEEVFLRVGREGREIRVSHAEDTEKDRKEALDESMQSYGATSTENAGYAAVPVSANFDVELESDLSFFSSFVRHVRALLIKRFTNARRDRKVWLWTVLLPLFTVTLGLGIQTLQVQNEPAVTMSTAAFNSPNPVPYAAAVGATPVFPFNVSHVSDSLSLNAYAVSNVSTVPLMSMYLLSTLNANALSRYGAFINNVNVDTVTGNVQDRVVVYHNTTAVYSLPANLNLYDTLLVRALTANNKITITVQAHPFPLTQNEKQLFTSLIAIFIGFGFAFIPASFISYTVKEEGDKVKHQQLISGVSSLAYWLSSYMWDFVNFIVPALLCYAIVAMFNIQELIGSASSAVFVGLILYGLSVIPFSYCCSFLFDNYTTAQNSMLLIFLLAGAILLVAGIVLDIFPSTVNANKVLKFFYRLFPSYCFGETLTNLITRDSITATYGNPRGVWDMYTVGWPFIFMFLESIVFFLIVLIVEKVRSTPALLGLLGKFTNPPLRVFDDEDDDVVQIKRELEQLDGPNQDTISVRGLRKVYPSRMGQPPKIAVHDLWLSIPKGQCYGYLGINGAGKTTTLKMLTGDVIPTAGTAYLDGLDINTSQEELRRLLGYCPQFDALIDSLTAREHLTLFARIKGVKESSIVAYVQSLIDCLGLQKGIEDKPCGGYSGGNKRKLCVGIALIGNPPIVFLDEPSTGMDPGSRRQMWNLISSTMSGRSVILTTHSMEECEALCQKIGVMVGGRLRCTGTTQHLKSKYGQGYQVDVHVEIGAAADNFVKFFTSTFPEAKLIEHHGDDVKYRIPKFREGSSSDRVSISSVFKAIESAKSEFGDRFEYSVSETTLEQIFIYFAKQQEEETGVVAGLVD